MKPFWRYLRGVFLAVFRPGHYRRLGEQAILFAQKSAVLERELEAAEAVGVDLVLMLQTAQRLIVRLEADTTTLNGYVARLEEKLEEHGVALSAD